MAKIDDFAGLLKELGKPDEIAPELGVAEVTVRQWGRRRNIPSEYWNDIVAAAEARHKDNITLELLARLAAAEAGRPA